MGVFVERVTSRFRLDPEELRFLERLEARAIPVRRGQLIARSGEPADQVFVLMTGWAMSYTQFPDGSHQVRRLHFAGDLLAMPSVPMQHHAEDIEAISDAVVAPFPKLHLTEMFRLPRLAAIMYMFAQAERITAGDRLASLGRTSAKGRIAFLLLDIIHRLRSADPATTCSFIMHLSREQIAHVTGMTPVHASRMWCSLVADGLISCEGRLVTLLDEQGLQRLSQYSSRDGDFDHNWLAAVDRVFSDLQLCSS